MMDDDVNAQRKFYDPADTYRGALEPGINQLRDRIGISDDEADAHRRHMAEAFDDANIAPGEAATLHGLVSKYMAEPPDDGTAQTWAVETRKMLREEGVSQRKLELVAEFVAERPYLAQVLADTQLGNHPDLVRAMLERATGLRVTPMETPAARKR